MSYAQFPNLFTNNRSFLFLRIYFSSLISITFVLRKSFPILLDNILSMWLRSGWVFIVVLTGCVSKLIQGLIWHFWMCCVGISCLPNSLISTDIGHWGKYSLNQVLKEKEVLLGQTKGRKIFQERQPACERWETKTMIYKECLPLEQHMLIGENYTQSDHKQSFRPCREI